MNRFAALYAEVESTTRTNDKVAAVARYFREAPPADAAWALAIFTGRRLKRVVSYALLAKLAASEAGIPEWLLHECHSAVGDFGETVSLLLPEPTAREPDHVPSVAEVIERRLMPMRRMTDAERAQVILQTWRALDQRERLVFQKLLSGTFRFGVSSTLAVRALADVAGVPQAEMAARLMGEWVPSGEFFSSLLRPREPLGPAGRADLAPYPFQLAQQLDAGPAEAGLGEVGAWQAEWKWDGIRAQLVRRASGAALWSRGEELISKQFPELVAAGGDLPVGTVLDGEILAWEPGAETPGPFLHLQPRLQRVRRQATLFEDVPVRFVAYDLLERSGVDVRSEPMHTRRAALEAILHDVRPPMALSVLVSAQSWDALAAMRAQSRARGVEGLMLKHRDAAYGVGRTGRVWWKWKIEPYTVDAVLIYAQPGSGRRAGLLTDYTFALWDQGELVPVAKAYSGLSDEEIQEVDRLVRRHTLKTAGPVAVVEPTLVFELAFEAIQHSTRHRSGVGLRFPRIQRWRTDKRIEDADSVDRLRALIPAGHVTKRRQAKGKGSAAT